MDFNSVPWSETERRVGNGLLPNSAYLANDRIVKKWTMPIPNWALILNQLVIRFNDRIIM